MKIPAKDITLAKKLVTKMSEYSTEEVLAGVLKINASDLSEEKVDAIRICILVKKLLSRRHKKVIPGSED